MGHSTRLLLLFALAAALMGCTRVQMRVSPPPQLPTSPVKPDTPGILSEPTDFDVTVDTKTVGNERLRLPRQTVGVAPLSGAGLTADLQGALVRALLEHGFRSVFDLDATSFVHATHSSRLSGADVTLAGKMSELMELAQLTRASVLIVPEIVETEVGQTTLPIHFWYDEKELERYQTAVDVWSENQTNTVTTIDALVEQYNIEFGAAAKEYEENRPFWQSLPDLFSKSSEEKAWEQFQSNAERLRSRLSGTALTIDEIRDRAADRKEVQPRATHRARIRVRVIDVKKGSLLALLESSIETLDASEITDRLAEAVAVTLEGR